MFQLRIATAPHVLNVYFVVVVVLVVAAAVVIVFVVAVYNRIIKDGNRVPRASEGHH